MTKKTSLLTRTLDAIKKQAQNAPVEQAEADRIANDIFDQLFDQVVEEKLTKK